MGAPRKYPLELRERAVLLGVGVAPADPAGRALDLGIHHEALRRVGAVGARPSSGRRRDLLTSAERDELKRLRNENAELRRANVT